VTTTTAKKNPFSEMTRAMTRAPRARLKNFEYKGSKSIFRSLKTDKGAYILLEGGRDQNLPLFITTLSNFN